MKVLARAITIVENELPGCDQLLENLVTKNIPVIGITGPPGAGKSSLVNSVVKLLLQQHKRIGVVAVDPTSPFNFGSLLGDRIRLSEHFNHPDVFIRSMASRGSLGGLSEKITEVIDVMKAFPFDYIFIETVGVGQAEVEIAGLADTTVVVLVPEGGDEVQTMKAGLMEIADIFVVNKSDHVGADRFAKNLKTLSASRVENEWRIPVIKTIAIEDDGISLLLSEILHHKDLKNQNERKAFLFAERAWRIIQKERMKNVDRALLLQEVRSNIDKNDFNLYRLAKKYT